MNGALTDELIESLVREADDYDVKLQRHRSPLNLFRSRKHTFLALPEEAQFALVRQTTTDLVMEHPDHIDENARSGTLCRYVVDNEPSCIVACVLYDLGWDIETLLKNEGRSMMSSRLNGVSGAFPELASLKIRSYLMAAQLAQDTGRPWAAAWLKAEKWLADYEHSVVR